MNFKLFIIETKDGIFLKRSALDVEEAYKRFTSTYSKEEFEIKTIFEVVDIHGIKDEKEPLEMLKNLLLYTSEFLEEN